MNEYDKNRVNNQIFSDIEFLQSYNLMDYSLLLAIEEIP